MTWRHLILILAFIHQSFSEDNITEINNSDNFINALDDFGYRIMMKMMKQRLGANIVISPTGIASLLAMTLLGTVGKTYDELAETLGFSQDILENRNHHEQLGKRLQLLDSSNGTLTQNAGAVFVDVRTKLRDEFRSYLSHVYRAEALSVDFHRREEARDIINEWVKNHTNDRIKHFLKQDLPAITSVVLVSALYFNGQWAQPFLPDLTVKMPFKKLDGEVMTDLMLGFGKYEYIFAPEYNLQMIALPYNDSATTMYVLKPRMPKQQSLTELLERLNYENINGLINRMQPENCVIRFPKMNLQSNINLESSLKELGVLSMFTPGQANFALMVNTPDITTRLGGKEDGQSLKKTVDSLPNPGLHVDSVIHDVKININEYGTEAVAATAAFLSRTAEQFYADSPFYMFIRNENTQLVTFSAVVFDPADSLVV